MKKFTFDRRFVANRPSAGIRADESAVTSIEYALLGALIAVVIVVSVTNLGSSLLALYNLVSTQVTLAL